MPSLWLILDCFGDKKYASTLLYYKGSLQCEKGKQIKVQTEPRRQKRKRRGTLFRSLSFSIDRFLYPHLFKLLKAGELDNSSYTTNALTRAGCTCSGPETRKQKAFQGYHTCPTIQLDIVFPWGDVTRFSIPQTSYQGTINKR